MSTATPDPIYVENHSALRVANVLRRRGERALIRLVPPIPDREGGEHKYLVVATLRRGQGHVATVYSAKVHHENYRLVAWEHDIPLVLGKTDTPRHQGTPGVYQGTATEVLRSFGYKVTSS